MQLFHIKSEDDLQAIHPHLGDCFIVCNHELFNQVHETLYVLSREDIGVGKDIDTIHFESFADHDAISFSFFDWQNSTFIFEKVHLYISQTFFIFVCDKQDEILQNAMEGIRIEDSKQPNGMDTLTYVYYKLLDQLISKMFYSLEQFEDYIAKEEAQLLKIDTSYSFDKIATIKTAAFEVKRRLRLLGYIGDQIISNDNSLINDKYIKYFKNISAKSGRLYEFGASLHEKTEHLMDLYNTAVSGRSNASLNKLAVLSIFATPITVLSGVYGMNFTNMPELKSENGYFILLAIMLCISIVIYILLKRKRML